MYATIAQLVERLTCNEDVAGSIPAGGSAELFIGKRFWGRCPSGQREQTVNLPAYAYGGSNPSLPTINAGVAQLVEHQPSKLRVASSNLVARSSRLMLKRLVSVG